MTHTISDWVKMYPQWDHSKIMFRDSEQILVDLVELSKGLIGSVRLLQSVIDSLAESEQLRQEQV